MSKVTEDVEVPVVEPRVLDENAPKRIKQEESEDVKKEDSVKEETANVKSHECVVSSANSKSERCIICRQYIEEVAFYNGHPNNAVEEYIALTDEKLSLFTGDEVCINQHDERPTHKVSIIKIY